AWRGARPGMTTSMSGPDPMVAGSRGREAERPCSGPLRCSKLIRAISGGAGLHAAGADAPLDVGVEELRPRRGADAQEHVDVGVAELRVGEHRFRRAVGEVAALALRLQDDEAAAARGQRRAVRPRDLGPRRAPDDVLALAPERGLRLQRAQRLVALV